MLRAKRGLARSRDCPAQTLDPWFVDPWFVYKPWIGRATLGLLVRKAWIRTILGLPCAKHIDQTYLHVIYSDG